MKENFLRFMTSTKGRVARVVIGIILIALGIFVIRGPVGNMITIAALIPIAGGLFDFCVVAFLMGYPFSGPRVRQMLSSR